MYLLTYLLTYLYARINNFYIMLYVFRNLKFLYYVLRFFETPLQKT